MHDTPPAERSAHPTLRRHTALDSGAGPASAGRRRTAERAEAGARRCCRSMDLLGDSLSRRRSRMGQDRKLDDEPSDATGTFGRHQVRKFSEKAVLGGERRAYSVDEGARRRRKWNVLSFTSSLDERIAVALQAADAALPLAFPVVGRKGRVPCPEQALLSGRKAQAWIGGRHIQRCPCHDTLGGVRRFHPVAVYLDATGTKGGGRVRQQRRGMVGAGSVDGSDGGEKVVHVRLHTAKLAADLFRAAPPLECRAVRSAAPLVPLAPGGKRSPELRRRDDVLPFEPIHAMPVDRACKSRWRGDFPARVKVGAAIHCLTVVWIDLSEQQTLSLSKAFQPCIAGDDFRSERGRPQLPGKGTDQEKRGKQRPEAGKARCRLIHI